MDGSERRGGRRRRRRPRRPSPPGRPAASTPGALGPTPQPLSRPCAASAAVGGLVSRSRRVVHRASVHADGRVRRSAQPLERFPFTYPRRFPLPGCAGRLEPSCGAARRPCGAPAASRTTEGSSIYFLGWRRGSMDARAGEPQEAAACGRLSGTRTQGAGGTSVPAEGRCGGRVGHVCHVARDRMRSLPSIWTLIALRCIECGSWWSSDRLETF